VLPAPPTVVQSKFTYNPASSAWSQLREVFGDKVRGRAVLGISWFWGLGTVFTSELIPLVRNQLFAHETVATLLLTLFSVGIAIGSLLVGRLLRGRVSARHAMAALIVLALASLDLGYTIYHWQNLGDAASFAAFLHHPDSWRLIADFTVFAVASGVFIVPLYAILQVASHADNRGQAVGANNIVNAAFQVSAALGAGALITAGWTPGLVLTAAGVSGLLMIGVLRPLAGDFGVSDMAAK
jgi:acyl-[acyl-carrier-protein]-phospholipid O-acyltransferase/long-chain-fatty-acid--[acyl-carrier-protein] ligase